MTGHDEAPQDAARDTARDAARALRRRPAVVAPLTYVVGDVTQPIGDGPRIIPHICNDVNKFGAGVALAIAKRWPVAKTQYHAWAEGRLRGSAFALGHVHLVPVGGQLWVANCIAQHGVGKDSVGQPPIRYDALETALSKVAEKARERNATIHAPRLGTLRAGGDWERIEAILRATCCAYGVAVTIYDLPKK